MAVTTKAKLHGLKELHKALDELTHKSFRKNALTAGGRKAMAPLLAECKNTAPFLTTENAEKNKGGESGNPATIAGTLKNDIKFRGKYNTSPKFKKKGTLAKGTLSFKMLPLNQYEWVGQIKTGKASEQYALILEYGREEYTVVRIWLFNKLVNPYKATMIEKKARPWFRNALHKMRDGVLDDFLMHLKDETEKKAKAQKRHIKKIRAKR